MVPVYFKKHSSIIYQRVQFVEIESSKLLDLFLFYCIRYNVTIRERM
jgi:hypothetical protein